MRFRSCPYIPTTLWLWAPFAIPQPRLARSRSRAARLCPLLNLQIPISRLDSLLPHPVAQLLPLFLVLRSNWTGLLVLILLSVPHL